MGDKWGAPQPRSEERREESTPPPLAPRSRPRPPLARTLLTPAPRSSCPRSAPVWGAGNAPAAHAHAPAAPAWLFALKPGLGFPEGRCRGPHTSHPIYPQSCVCTSSPEPG